MSSHDLAVQRLAYAALDTLRAALDLDLCAYLHGVEGEGPQLYLRSPDLAAMTPTAAFELFTALRDVADDHLGETAVRRPIGAYAAVAVHAAGPVSRGVFAVGRTGSEIDDDELAVVTTVCAAMGDACQLLEAAGSAQPAPAGAAPPETLVTLGGIAVSVENGMASAEVTWCRADGSFTRGQGSAIATVDAVALATLDASASRWKLGGISEALVDGERVMVVLLRDGENDGSTLGAATVDADPVKAAALAVADALVG